MSVKFDSSDKMASWISDGFKRLKGFAHAFHVVDTLCNALRSLALSGSSISTWVDINLPLLTLRGRCPGYLATQSNRGVTPDPVLVFFGQRGLVFECCVSLSTPLYVSMVALCYSGLVCRVCWLDQSLKVSAWGQILGEKEIPSIFSWVGGLSCIRQLQ